ncbi:hypothetical protein DSI41_02630, partial [Mycobacterium tuberculosis]
PAVHDEIQLLKQKTRAGVQPAHHHDCFGGEASHVNNTRTSKTPTYPGTQEGHLRVQPGYRLRVVRLL